jgi:hypothetical protein
MVISDVGKLVLIGGFLIGMFVLVAAQAVEWGEAAPFMTLVAGYLFGNGESAVRKSAPSPTIVPALEPGTVATVHGPVTADKVTAVHRYDTDEDGNL